jgi:hypothetical protein
MHSIENSTEAEGEGGRHAARGVGRLLRPTESSRARDVGRPVCTELQIAQMLSQAGVRPADVLTAEDVRVLANRYIAGLAAAGYLPMPMATQQGLDDPLESSGSGSAGNNSSSAGRSSSSSSVTRQRIGKAYRDMRPQKVRVTYNELGERRMERFEDPNARGRAGGGGYGDSDDEDAANKPGGCRFAQLQREVLLAIIYA